MRLIDADALVKNAYEGYMEMDPVMVVDLDDINEAETIEVEPVRHGHWIIDTDWHGIIGLVYRKCSECGTVFQGSPFTRGDKKGCNFCEECGAKMDGGKNNE